MYLFLILFPFKLLQNIDQSSLCYIVGPGWLFKYSSVYMSVPDSQYIPPLYLNPIMWLKKMLDMISIFLSLPKIDLWPKIWSILENVACALEKKVYSAAFR